MLGDFASLDVQNTYRGSDAYVLLRCVEWQLLRFKSKGKVIINNMRTMQIINIGKFSLTFIQSVLSQHINSVYLIKKKSKSTA
ncbi:hypothetical protein [Piscirickettsia salmonis]|uniref:hypothetical protein n=1 Tax=Piscirickettsia salmonis TaxID=1238 RepID=UPI0012DB0328|nr:hypothetical protein [Piscirickettsia salmonis]